MSWVDVFAVLVVSHLAGDFLLQTDWQATHKHGGLGHDPTARRALAAHLTTYTLAFVPAFVWLGANVGARTVAVAALVAIPHLAQDDGRPVSAWISAVKHGSAVPGNAVFVSVDQSFHALVLFGAALLATA